MPELLGVFLEALRSTLLVCGLVVVMMMIIETVNVGNQGRFFSRLGRPGFFQILVSALLGSLPGCVGGFAVVSLYTHRMLSFGALVAMMVATAGDESFMMLAMFPDKATLLLATLLAVAVVTGLVVDKFSGKSKPLPTRLEDSFELHAEEAAHLHSHDHAHPHGKEHGHSGSALWKRILMFLCVVLFILALVSGMLEEGEEEVEAGFNLLSEDWMFWLFGGLSLIVLVALVRGSDHFVEEHLWKHVVCRHLPNIFAWTFGMLLAVGLLFHFVNIEAWIGENTLMMIFIAVLVGFIPQSGPHLVFVTLFAGGAIPFSVLLANSITQDGHASLPLLADSKTSFFKAKAIKASIALVLSITLMLLGF